MDDPVLVRKAKAGDPRAFEALASPYESMVWRVCWQLMNSREDAQDCAQEAMLKAWTHITSWRETASFSTWLYRIAVTCCLDARRRQKSRPADSVDAMQESGITLPSDEPGPHERLESMEHRERVRHALAALPDEQRIPLVLLCMEGKSYDEIASLLSLPEGTVKSRISRARLALKKSLDETTSPGNHSGSAASNKEERRQKP